MDLDFLAKQAAFRLEVRGWVEAGYPKAVRDKQATGDHPAKEELQLWHRILHRKGRCQVNRGRLEVALPRPAQAVAAAHAKAASARKR